MSILSGLGAALTAGFSTASASVRNFGAVISVTQTGFQKLGEDLAKTRQAMTQFAQNIGASSLPGGLSILGDAFTLFMAQVLKPLMGVFVDLTAWVMTLGDDMATMSPILKLVGASFSLVLDVTLRFAGIVQYALEVLNTFSMAVSDAVSWILNKLSLGTAGGSYYTAEDYAASSKRAKGGLEQAFTTDQGAMQKNRESVLQGLTTAFGKQANVGYAGIGDVSRQIQQNAFQSDIQSRILKVNEEQLAETRRVVLAIEKKPSTVGE